MALLSDSEITSLRADLNGMLPDTGTIGRLTRSSDGAGGATESWPSVATVPCRLTRIRARMSAQGAVRQAGGRTEDATTHTITFTASTDVRLRDRVTIGTQVFEVVDVRTGGDWELARHAEVKLAPN